MGKVVVETADRWKDKDGNELMPGDSIAVARHSGATLWVEIGTLERINLTDTKGNRFEAMKRHSAEIGSEEFYELKKNRKLVYRKDIQYKNLAFFDEKIIEPKWTWRDSKGNIQTSNYPAVVGVLKMDPFLTR